MPTTQSYLEWRTAIRRKLWVAPGEPRNLVDAHNAAFELAMGKLSRYCKRLQEANTSVYPACSTYVECAKTLVDCPPGILKRVYTVANNEYCDKVYYSQVPYRTLECMARGIVTQFTSPANTGMPALQQGIRYAEASTDSPYGRARVGVYAIYRNRLYLYPWIQSNEKIIVEWEGAQERWADTDILDLDLWTPEHADAVEKFVMYEHERKFGNDRMRTKSLEQDWKDSLADLIYEDQKMTEQLADPEECNSRPLTTAEITDDAVPAPPGTDYMFAMISDYGEPPMTPTQQVSALVKSWGPRFIVTAGDNTQQLGYDYEETITPYYGEYVADNLADNRFFPTLGNHDISDPSFGLNSFLAYFTLPNDERKYDFVKGSVHFFILNVNASEPDGVSSTSVQAEWLRVKMALSTAKWKVVVLHYPPYTTGQTYPGNTTLRWGFTGADVVISGHTHGYERFEVDGKPYLVIGTAGANLDNLNANPVLIAEYLKYRYSAKHGAVKCTASCTELKFQFINLDGTVLDTLTLTKT